LSSKSSY